MKLTRKQLGALLLYVERDQAWIETHTGRGALCGVHAFGDTVEAGDGIGLLRLRVPGAEPNRVVAAKALRQAVREMMAEEYDLTDAMPVISKPYPNCDKLIPEKKLPGRGVAVLHMGADQLIRIGRTAERLGAKRVRLQFKQDAVTVRLDYGGQGSDDPEVVGVVARFTESFDEGDERRAAKKAKGMA